MFGHRRPAVAAAFGAAALIGVLSFAAAGLFQGERPAGRAVSSAGPKLAVRVENPAPGVRLQSSDSQSAQAAGGAAPLPNYRGETLGLALIRNGAAE